ncbi:MAG TPA: oligopeptide transporter, OPT family [Gemmatimonadales bacterium]|jgi:putative OPT family oligopeptide transporter
MSAPATFKPYVPDDASVPELTVRAVILGAIAGIVFGAVSVYLALRAGLTVSASIPIAVIAITVLKRFHSTILENNIVQTAGSAGESIASGVVFTLPALIFLGFQLQVSRAFLMALAGGILGVLFMIPLRRTLIVKEHGNLLYPEGAACADVLIAGERGGRFAGRVFTGLLVGALYKVLQEGVRLWKATPTYDPAWYPGGRIAGTTTPEYLGVGYIIGVRISGLLFAGGVLSWLVIIPLIKFFGSHIHEPIFPGTIPIGDMTPSMIWNAYIRSIGAGAVTASGLITLARTLPTIWDSLKAGMRDIAESRAGIALTRARTSDDLPLTIVIFGALAMILVVFAILTFSVNPGRAVANAFASVLIVVFGFIFVTVSSRITGLIGNSSNPISGMAIATLMMTCLIFVLLGWTGGTWPAVALTVGGVVCIAAANAGATSQDLKTGFLVGATPWRQQVSLLVGALASVAVIGFTLTKLNDTYTAYDRQAIHIDSLAPEMKNIGPATYQGSSYQEINVIGSHTIPDGRYYYNPAAHQLEWKVQPGIGSQQMPAPQAILMTTVINGILSQNLQWGLVLFGVFVVIVIELLGVRSLPFATGSYLPISTTAAIFAGGVVRWFVERGSRTVSSETDVSSGSLMASGLIAGGALAGLLIVVPMDSWRNHLGELARTAHVTLPYEWGDVGGRYWPAVQHNDLVALAAFALLCGFLYRVAKKPLETT